MNGIFLSIYVGFVKGGGDKERSKAFECAVQLLIIYVKEVGRLCVGSKGVMTAAILFNELLVFVRFWEGLGTKKQHMLQKVGQTLAAFRIIHATNVHTERCTGLIRFRSFHEKNFQAVFKLHVPVLVGVRRADDQVGGL